MTVGKKPEILGHVSHAENPKDRSEDEVPGAHCTDLGHARFRLWTGSIVRCFVNRMSWKARLLSVPSVGEFTVSAGQHVPFVLAWHRSYERM
jgi:hypothetical protein